MPTPIPRKIYEFGRVRQAPEDSVICRYLPLWKFESMITSSALYFRRLDAFDDRLEGKLPQAVWELQNDAMQEWYAANGERIFVLCWHSSDTESADMWKEYANGRGVVVYSTVHHLRAELSNPPLPVPPPMPDEYAELASTPGVNVIYSELPEHDGFTTGIVEYIDRENVDVYEMLSEGLSDTTPVFRKAMDYIHELEYRAILRPASASENRAHVAGLVGLDVPVNLEVLLQEIRYSPGDDTLLSDELQHILRDSPVLRGRLKPSRLGT